jgi:enamine deaminase RidA (YjgF/YER057c/UK114 family)
MSHVELIRSPKLWNGVPYSYASSVPAGARLVHLAGACPLNDDGSTAAVGDIRGQTLKCIENLRAALDAAGARMNDVVFVRVLVASTVREDLSAAWNVVRQSVGDHEVPGTLMGVTVLGWPDQLVEVEAVAAVVDGTTRHDG